MDEFNEKDKCFCKHDDKQLVKKYGYTKNGVQRYYCKKCGKTFLERKKKYGYSRLEKRFLSMLINFMQADRSGTITLGDALANIDIENPQISKFRFIQRIPEDSEAVFCYKPRILICEENNDIIIYRFEDREPNRNSRSIKIIDQDVNRGRSIQEINRTRKQKGLKQELLNAE